MHWKLKRVLESYPAGQAYLKEQAQAKRAKSKRTAPKRAASVKAKRDRKAIRAEMVAALREAVFAREGGRCALCGDTATEMHHLRGAAERRPFEALDSCAALCFECHRKAHRSDTVTLSALSHWALMKGYTATSARLHVRLSKVMEARRTPSVPVRIEVSR